MRIHSDRKSRRGQHLGDRMNGSPTTYRRAQYIKFESTNEEFEQFKGNLFKFTKTRDPYDE